MRKKVIFWLLASFNICFFNQQNLDAQQYAPDFTMEDIYGNTHNLYNYLADGKIVILDFFVVYADVCTETVTASKKIWDNYGDDGNKSTIMLAIEADKETTLEECFYSYGFNWSEEIAYPIINDKGILTTFFNVSDVPNFFVIYPDLSYFRVKTDPSVLYPALKNAIEAVPEFVVEGLDIALFSGTPLNSVICEELLELNITIANVGSKPVQSMDIVFKMNEWTKNYNWEGNLASYEVINMTLSNIEMPPEGDYLAILDVLNVNEQEIDDLPDNNILQSEVKTLNPYEMTSVELLIVPDNYPEDISWVIKDENDDIVAMGSDYDYAFEEVLCLKNDQCYTFSIFDDYGDGFSQGGGSVKMTMDDSYVLFEFTEEQFGYASNVYEANFCLENILSMEPPSNQINEFTNPAGFKINVIPNPADHFIHLSTHISYNNLFNDNQKPLKICLSDLYGQCGLYFYLEKDIYIDTSDIPSGIYCLKDEFGNAVSSKIVIFH